MNIIILFVVSFCVLVIGFAPLAFAIPHEGKDLKDFKIEEKQFKHQADDLKDSKIEENELKKEAKTKDQGWKANGYEKPKEYERSKKNSIVVQNTSVQTVPEPESFLMLGLGLLALRLCYQWLHFRRTASNTRI